jgi:hypothetical protein
MLTIEVLVNCFGYFFGYLSSEGNDEELGYATFGLSVVSGRRTIKSIWTHSKGVRVVGYN